MILETIKLVSRNPSAHTQLGNTKEANRYIYKYVRQTDTTLAK